MPTWLALSALGLAALLFIVAVLVMERRGLVRARLDDADEAGEPIEARGAGLAHWLARAGFRDRRATAAFLLATGALAASGIALAIALQPSVDRAVDALWTLPGAVGELPALLTMATPILLAVLLAVSPALAVTAARSRRVAEVEADLPLLLDLLATLAEAGFGFDSALARVLDVEQLKPALARELRVFQLDLLAGRSRVAAMRALADRLEVPALSAFVAALIQAEQIGSSIAETLRHQADDARRTQRERLLLTAETLPIKLAVPLVLCFLPGIFVIALGPAVHRLFELADQVTTGL